MKTMEEQKAFADELQRLTDEMGKILEMPVDKTSLNLMSENIKSLAKLRSEYIGEQNE